MTRNQVLQVAFLFVVAIVLFCSYYFRENDQKEIPQPPKESVKTLPILPQERFTDVRGIDVIDSFSLVNQRRQFAGLLVQWSNGDVERIDCPHNLLGERHKFLEKIIANSESQVYLLQFEGGGELIYDPLQHQIYESKKK